MVSLRGTSPDNKAIEDVRCVLAVAAVTAAGSSVPASPIDVVTDGYPAKTCAEGMTGWPARGPALLGYPSANRQKSLDLYMSTSRRSIGMGPMVLRKKSSSMVAGDMDRREGSMSRSLPNLKGWVG